MGRADRYRDLLIAVKRHALKLGESSVLSVVPEADEFPFIIKLGQDTSEQAGVVFLFPPSDPFINSDVIGYIAKVINDGPELKYQPILLVSDKVLPHISHVLDATGIDKHVDTKTYSFRDDGYKMDWELSMHGNHKANARA